MCSVMLLVYLLTLVFIAASRHVEEPKIWVSDVRSLRAAAVRQSSPSIPNSPLTARFKKRPSVDIYTPHHPRYCPVQPLPHHMALSTDYEIEPFHPVFAAPEQMDIPHASDLPEAIPLPHAPIIPSFTKPIPPLPPKETRNARSLLPQFDMRPEPVSSVQHPSSGRPSRPMPAQSNSIPLPLPLGDWPRQDVMQLPAKLKRKPRPPSAFEFPRRHLVTTDRACVPADTTNTSVTQPRPRRPSGPRQRIPSGDAGYRPAPQDLYPFSVGRRDT
ncbi:hypothetical protein OG21DRAFT_341296 [Imleria badia]|nr:hypothetical protein OG21DRAFT_341296 [Imleria badia]